MKQTTKDMPHNGSLLEKYIAEQHTVKAGLARAMGITPSGVNVYFTRKSLQMGIWWRASLALRHNFISELGEALNIDYETQTEAKLRKEIALLQTELDELKVKLSVYESIMKK
ncbi:MAG: hypothetical protein LBR81_03205 [Prevotellaceae bacterium]|jgi:plasmid maintenance system antidote protein VapI|nr:hypothetical protein [Prevotellaceae bacterium]